MGQFSRSSHDNVSRTALQTSEELALRWPGSVWTTTHERVRKSQGWPRIWSISIDFRLRAIEPSFFSESEEQEPVKII